MSALARAAVFLAVALSLAACTAVFGKEYEYEEQWTLATDGSAVVVIDASIPALVALHGLALDPSPLVRLETADVPRVFEQAGCTVVRVGQPWRRDGRRFIQVRLSVGDVRRAGTCGPLSWSQYSLDRDDATRTIHYRDRKSVV